MSGPARRNRPEWPLPAFPFAVIGGAGLKGIAFLVAAGFWSVVYVIVRRREIRNRAQVAAGQSRGRRASDQPPD